MSVFTLWAEHVDALESDLTQVEVELKLLNLIFSSCLSSSNSKNRLRCPTVRTASLMSVMASRRIMPGWRSAVPSERAWKLLRSSWWRRAYLYMSRVSPSFLLASNFDDLQSESEATVSRRAGAFDVSCNGFKELRSIAQDL